MNLGLNIQMSILIPQDSPIGGDRRGQTVEAGGSEPHVESLGPNGVGPAVPRFLGDLRKWSHCGKWSHGGLLSTCAGISMMDST